MSYLSQEHFLIMILDNHNRLIAEKTLFIGSVNMSIVSAREILEKLSLLMVSVSSVFIIILQVMRIHQARILV